MIQRLLFAAFLVNMLLAGCYKDSTYNTANLSGYDTTVHILLDYSSIPADSFSITRVLVELPYNADSTKASVSFKTDLGYFVETGLQTAQITATQNIDSVKRIAIATLHSGTLTGIAHLQVTSYTQVKMLTDTFVNAYPDYIQFSASTLALQPSNGAAGTVSFTCQLFKLQGWPSQLNIVTVNVYDTSYAHTYGSFSVYDNRSNLSGNTMFTYVLGDSVVDGLNYTGILHAVSTVASDAKGDNLADTIRLVSSPPAN
jgi:hypothetical protein